MDSHSFFCDKKDVKKWRNHLKSCTLWIHLTTFPSIRASERWYSPPSSVNWGWGMETEWLDYSWLLSWKEKGERPFPKTYGFFPWLPSKHKWTQFTDRWNFQTKSKLLASVWKGPEGLQTVSWGNSIQFNIENWSLKQSHCCLEDLVKDLFKGILSSWVSGYRDGVFQNPDKQKWRSPTARK